MDEKRSAAGTLPDPVPTRTCTTTSVLVALLQALQLTYGTYTKTRRKRGAYPLSKNLPRPGLDSSSDGRICSTLPGSIRAVGERDSVDGGGSPEWSPLPPPGAPVGASLPARPHRTNAASYSGPLARSRSGTPRPRRDLKACRSSLLAAAGLLVNTQGGTTSAGVLDKAGLALCEALVRPPGYAREARRAWSS
ncbi:hypothetical protein F4824DRAFT_499983 [Ustulina deusta]|nr:hypothetical protein F4824DRAFT_499983 [Ustulina deusta]